jgi:YVTN family beta-propeller protein
MSDRRSNMDIEQALTDWADEVAPKSPPARLLESTFVRTMGTNQVRVYPWNKLMLGRRGLSNSGSGARFGILVLAGMVILAMAIGFIGGGFRPTATPTPSPTPQATAGPSELPSPSLPAPIAVTVDATLAVQNPTALVWDGEFLWLMVPGRIDRIDTGTNAVTGSATLASTTDQYNGLAVSEDGLWATNSDASMLYRVDPATLTVAANITAGQAPKGVLANADGVWVADVHGGTVLRINAATNRVAATITLNLAAPNGPNWLGEGLGSIWVDTPRNATIDRIDPVTNAVQATIQTHANFTPCGGFTFTSDAAWVTSCSAGNTMARVDATSNTVVATVNLQGHGYNPTLINGFPWVSVDTGDAETGQIVRIDPATNSIDRVLVPDTTFGGGGDIVVADGSVWVLDGYNSALLRLPFTAFAP